jgi:hypothetical protein
MNHMPWDRGALRLLGEIVQQRTIKAYCGRRVSFAAADERQPITCAECSALVTRENESNARLERELAALGFNSSASAERRNPARETQKR